VVCLETYDTEQDAALAHDRAVLAALGPAATAGDLNFPTAAAHLTNQPGSSAAAAGAWAAAAADPGMAAGGAQLQQQQQQQQQAQREYKGVAWDPVNLKYQAQALDSTGAVQLLGLYSTAEEAAAEYDRRLVKSGIRDESKLNFGLARYVPLACHSSSMPASAASSLSGQGSMGMHVSPFAAELAAATASNAAAAAAAAAGASGYAYAAAEEPTDVEAAADSAHTAAAGAKGRGRGKGAKGVQKAGTGKGGRKSNNPQSQYKGVSWSASTNRWAAVIWDR
jgi:hypothetical protein